jgi:hypothetical protein
MSDTNNLIAFVNPSGDPRINPVASLSVPALPDPPSDLFQVPEASPLGRLHLAHDYDPVTEDQMRTLDAAEALQRLVDAHGLDEIHSLLKLIAIGRGRSLA